MYEPITIKRLNDYTEIVKELDFLLRQKEQIKSKLGILSGVDYSKIKVTAGNRQKTSEQEHYAMALQKVNKKIDEYKAWLVPEHSIIKTQIARVKKWNYRKILVLRYLEKWKWSEIIQDFFEFEDDYETEKDTKYKDIVMYWHRRALEELEKVSAKPYVLRSLKQLVLEEQKGELQNAGTNDRTGN